MSIEVIRAGVQTTVQDLGRHGLQRFGVPVSGAMDTYSLRVANLIVGNDEGAGALEMTLDGPQLEFQTDALVAICGGDFEPSIGDRPVPTMRPVWIACGTRLAFARSRIGCRAYLAIAGGIDVPPVLGSRATYVRAGLGGIDGRALKSGDRLATASVSPQRYPRICADLRHRKCGFAAPNWSVAVHAERLTRRPQAIRFVAGRHWEFLTAAGHSRFTNSEYRIGSASDRMGYRLEGAPLEGSGRGEVTSEATAFGTIQLPPDGYPIVLMADRQTTGGYPRVGEVVSVDLPLLAQLKPGDTLRFERVVLAEAQQLWHAQSGALAQIREAIRSHINE